MPRGATVILFLTFIFGAIFLARQFEQSNPGPTDIGTMSARLRTLESEPAAVESDGIAVYFSPHGGCESACVTQIESATQTIDMQCYSFTAKNISHALVDAQSRGVHVRVIFDKNAADEHGSQAEYLESSGIPTFSDGQHPIAHNKIILIDHRTILTGSFNFTNQAEKSNAENLLVLTNKPTLADAYEQNFEEHLSHSDPYSQGQGRESRPR